MYELKVNVYSTSKEDFALFNSLFIQTKWIQNDMIASNDIFNYDYKSHRTIQNFDKDKNFIKAELERVKAKLVELQKTERSFEISKWPPSTKFCPCCGSLNTGITLSDRVYRCDCGYQFDRDVHAAKNVKLFGSTTRAECLEQASVETLASAALEVNSNIAS